MLEVKGKYGVAKVFNNNTENTALTQIAELMNQDFLKGSQVRIMSDAHSGKGCVIGTTMALVNRVVVPNLVGVDIGCGMEVVQIDKKKRQLDLGQIDSIIHKHIPAGFEVRAASGVHKYIDEVPLEDLRCLKKVNLKRAQQSLGTLGGGNHFIEINEDENGNIYIVVHTGSRQLGKQVCDYYQNLGYDKLTSIDDERKEIIERCKAEGRAKDISKEISLLQRDTDKVNKMLAYVENDDFDDYIHDMKITQKFAVYNRKAIIDEIIKKLKLDVVNEFTTIHNYIDMDNMILRKGAISAQKGEVVLIPMNMRDGSLICVGKGNPDWNFSAPHGAGRLMSRGQARQTISMKDFKESMEGIYTTCVNNSTIDESAFAYKPMKEIIDNVGETVEIKSIIKPLYNFKASEDDKPFKKKRK